mgnify:CR=1 FL=1
MKAPVRKVTLEVHQGSDPISGVISDEGGRRSFTGWLELAAALHAAVDGLHSDARQRAHASDNGR